VCSSSSVEITKQKPAGLRSWLQQAGGHVSLVHGQHCRDWYVYVVGTYSVLYQVGRYLSEFQDFGGHLTIVNKGNQSHKSPVLIRWQRVDDRRV
jgi:hypothetical protein